jgi:hypothetical protein
MSMVHATGTSTSAKLLNFSDGNITVRGKPCTVCTVPMVIAVRIRKEAASYERDCFFKLGNSVWHFSTGWSHLSYFLQFQFEFVNIIFSLLSIAAMENFPIKHIISH